MKALEVQGLIRRRILVNFRVDSGAMQERVPEPFRVKTVQGKAIAGICLIRLEQVRPGFLPCPVGVSSENAAHRVAVEWLAPDGSLKEGVYVPRRDTSSVVNAMAGGWLFPGDYRHASFQVTDEDGRIDFSMRSDDGATALTLKAEETDVFPAGSVFASLQEASDFFRTGSTGYSKSRKSADFDGMVLDTDIWGMKPLLVSEVHSSYFSAFEPGTAMFDSALLMRDIPHHWKPLPKLTTCEDGSCIAA